MWQDYIFAIGSIFFIIAIIPTLRSKTEKPKRISCAITAFWLWAFLAVYISFGLWFSFSLGLVSASAWTVLALQKRLKPLDK